MKKALIRFVDQGFEIYLWLAEIELNGVPKHFEFELSGHLRVAKIIPVAQGDGNAEKDPHYLRHKQKDGN